MRNFPKYLILCLVFSCQAQLTSSSKGGEPPPENEFENVEIPSYEEVVLTLRSNCTSCHGLDDEGNRGQSFALWGITDESMKKENFETDQLAPTIYQAIANKISKSPTTEPVAMPFGRTLTSEKRYKLVQVLAYFQANLPIQVSQAKHLYGQSDDLLPENIEIDYQCENLVSLREFLIRTSLALTDDSPPQALVDLLVNSEGSSDGGDSTDILDEPVTESQRQQIVDYFFTAPLTFAKVKSVGLKKLAVAVSGSSEISDHPHFNANQIRDIRQELYQDFLANFNSKSYDKYFVTNGFYKVMASSHTKDLYKCSNQQPPGQEWFGCIAPNRSSYFSTLGFLNRKRSSFLSQNNNYGRVAALYFAIFGQSFTQNTNGPTGDNPPPNPNCLEADDTRQAAGAGFGSAAVPQVGSTCQACHLDRYMAAGSVLFRPYSESGFIYNKVNRDDPQSIRNLDPVIYTEAIDSEMKYTTKTTDNSVEEHQVNYDFLAGLLNNAPQACPKEDYTGQPFTDIGDLAAYISRDRVVFATGFARHAHRAFSTSMRANIDLYTQINKSFTGGDGSVQDLMKTYFLTETFACGKDR